MKRIKKLLEGKKGTWILLAAAVLLLIPAVTEASRAALTYFSSNYTMQMQMYDIGVTLVEHSAQTTRDISNRDYTGKSGRWNEKQGTLLSDMLEETGGELELGRNYTEELSVKNSGNIDEYVRVRIMKSWKDENGKKQTDLDPSRIVLNLTQNGWLVDEKATTTEQMVLYWPYVVKPGESTLPFTGSICIDSALASEMTENTETENGYTTVTSDYRYDGAKFDLDVEVDAVQTHGAVDAIKSAWGVNVTIASDGTLRLAQ